MLSTLANSRWGKAGRSKHEDQNWKLRDSSIRPEMPRRHAARGTSARPLECIKQLLDRFAIMVESQGEHKQNASFLRMQIISNDETRLFFLRRYDDAPAAGARRQHDG